MERSPLTQDIRSYLKDLGATEHQHGAAGSLWSIGNEEIAVAHQVLPDSREWRSAVERIAYSTRSTETETAQGILGQFMDVAQLRAANDVLIEGSIPLDAGVKLVNSARGMLRAAATTAQRLRAQIGGSYSVLGDRIADEARLGHTIHGSYIIPVMMPLPRPQNDDDPAQPVASEHLHRVAAEPEQRRVMRTLAEALNAIERVIVEPDKEPRSEAIHEVVAAGASYELVTALRQIVGAHSVATFSASFDWASSTKAPGQVPARIEVPHAAADLLELTSRKLKTTRRTNQQSVTGPIVEVRHLPDDPFGEISVQTIRSGRPSEVRVRLRQDQVADCLTWMNTARTVLVTGRIERLPGRPLLIQSPDHLGPLDETYLDPFQGSH